MRLDERNPTAILRVEHSLFTGQEVGTAKVDSALMSATEDGSEDKAVVLGPVTIGLRSRSLKVDVQDASGG
ncbi:hypothetical protein PGTUg99_009318 [Puccinia graminis f. sp. tritici]|nr:hypothetical protein PGTUg99_009318 [Puccinia graminis f. sp. tritici]